MKNSTLKTCYSDDKNCLVTKLSCGHRIFVYNKMSCVWMQKYKTRYQLLVCVWFFHFFSLFSSVAPEILSVTNDNPNFWFSLKMISWQLNKHVASVSRKYKLLGLSAWKSVKHNQIWNISFSIFAEASHTKLAEGTDPHLQTTQQASDRNSIRFCCSSMPWSQPQGKEWDWAASSHYCQHLELPADEAHFGCAGFTWALHSESPASCLQQWRGTGLWYRGNSS